MSEITSGKEWRRGVEIELPSKKTALLRPFDFQILLRRKNVPDSLMPYISDLMDGDTSKLSHVATFEQKRDLNNLIDLVCSCMFVNPRIVDEPKADDEISLDDLEIDDKNFVWMMVGLGAEQMRSFRLEPEGTLGAVDEPTGNESATEPAAEPAAVGG